MKAISICCCFRRTTHSVSVSLSFTCARLSIECASHIVLFTMSSDCEDEEEEEIYIISVSTYIV